MMEKWGSVRYSNRWAKSCTALAAISNTSKATYYVSEDLAGNKLNDIRAEFFNPLCPPAASKAKVRGVAVPDKTITVDMIAVTK